MRIPAILHIFLTNVLRRRQSAVRQWDRSIRHRACPNHPELEKIRPVVISGYIEELQSTRSALTVNVLKADEARRLLDSIKTDTIVGLRDRALIALMCYTFARVSAVVHMKVEDYFTQNGKRFWIRLHEKGGKRHEVPAHHNAEAYLDQYLDAAGIRALKKSPLFRSVDRSRKLTENPLSKN